VAASVVEHLDGDVLLRFDVRDTGVGIEAGRESLLFESAGQADLPVVRRQGGAGLGLTIAKRLARLMHGDVGVESEAGKGSCFWFTARLGIERVAGGTAAAAGAGWRVLVASPNAHTAMALRRMLNAAGCDVLVEADGAAALAALRAAEAQGRPCELCLLDAALPDLPGSTAVAALGGLALATAPRLILLAAAGAQALPSASRDGVLAVLAKPVTRLALLDAIARARVPAAAATAEEEAAATGLAGSRSLPVADHETDRE
jgi:two-component system sensor histidine kinase/response regulator